MNHLSDELKTCSDETFGNAVLVALATHKDAGIKSLADGYSDAEIGDIALHTPAALLLIAGMVIDAAFKALKNSKGDNPEIEALAGQLEQAITDKQQLDAFLATPLYSRGKQYA